MGSPLTGGDNGETILYRLKKTLPQAKILIVIREQRAMLRSLYQLLVNWGCPYDIELLLNNDMPGKLTDFAGSTKTSSHCPTGLSSGRKLDSKTKWNQCWGLLRQEQ